MIATVRPSSFSWSWEVRDAKGWWRCGGTAKNREKAILAALRHGESITRIEIG